MYITINTEIYYHRHIPCSTNPLFKVIPLPVNQKKKKNYPRKNNTKLLMVNCHNCYYTTRGNNIIEFLTMVFWIKIILKQILYYVYSYNMRLG